VQVRSALQEAERQLEGRQQAALPDLQQWLQLTYEVESKYFELKREATDRQLKVAKEMVGILEITLVYNYFYCYYY